MRADKELAARLTALEERTAVAEQRLNGLHQAVRHLARALDAHDDAESIALRQIVAGLEHERELVELQLVRRAVAG